MSLAVDIEMTRGDIVLQVAITVDDGETLAVLGPNGAGKTSLVRAVAGLEMIDRGSISVDDVPVADTSSGLHRPPRERSIGMVFQSRALIPTMSALDNVAFGLRARGDDRVASGTAAREWLHQLEIEHLADRLPRHLSGGEAQRVALARALAPRPRVLLLDEPLTAVDAGARTRLRRVIDHHLDAFDGPSIIVTHDPVDAMVLADRAVVIEDGTIVQVGRPEEVLREPRCAYARALAESDAPGSDR